MKTALTSLILLGVAALNTIAEDTSQWGLPEGAVARFGRGILYNAKYSPDGRHLAVVSSAGVWLYDAVPGDPIDLIRCGNTFDASDVVFSRDGSTLAAGSDEIVCVWDAASGEQKYRYQLTEHHYAFGIRCFALSPDGGTLAVGILSGVNLMDVVAGKYKRGLSGERFGEVASLAFSPDGRTLVSGHKSASAGHSSGDTTIRVWDAATGELKITLERGFLGVPKSLAFSPDGRTLASGHHYSHIAGDQAGSISLWDAATWELKLELNTRNTGVVDGGGVVRIAYSPDGRILASGHLIDRYNNDEFGAVHLWNVETGENIRTLDGHPGGVRGVSFSRDGGTLAIKSSRGLSLWDAAAGTEKSQLGWSPLGVSRVAFSRDGRTVAGGGWRRTIHLWDAETWAHKHTLKGHMDFITSLAFSPAGGTLASGSLDTTIRLWDVDSGAHKRTLENVSSVPSIAFSPDGRRLASGGDVLRLYDAATGVHLRTLISPIDGVKTVMYSPDGRTIAGSNESEIRLWNAATGAHIHTLESGSSITFSPDSRTLAAVKEGKIHLWDVHTGKHRGTLEVPETDISYIAFTRNGRILAISRILYRGSIYGPVALRVWDAETGEHIRTLEGHTRDVYSVRFSPDGRMLASRSRDGTVLLWEILPDIENAQVEEPIQVAPDANGDGVVDIRDLMLIARRIGKSGEHRADVNGDGTVNILDLVIVAEMIDNEAGAPLVDSAGTEIIRITEVKKWLDEARRFGIADVALLRGIEYLENLLEALTPERTSLLPNYPNPFNPETWIPYHLARESNVRISIYSSKGVLVRQFDLGLQPEGFYTDKHYAAYWDGRNESGELLANGVYIYVFRAGSYRASRRMAIVR